MSIQTYCRCGIALFFAVLVAGCSSSGPSLTSPSRLFNACTWNPGGCRYEGAYEPGEREYAEEEAKRLNRAQSVKLRSSSN